MGSSWSLQKSIVQALKNDGDLSLVLGGQRIYDRVPQRTGYPFVSIGNTLVRDWSASGLNGFEHRLNLHVWSKARGKKQCFAIMDHVRRILHDVALVVEGCHLVNLRCEYFDARLDPDGETHHGVMRFRAVTELPG